MSINLALIGKVYPITSPYEVGREKIREFATARGDFNPAFHDVAAAQALGYRDLIAPPTFAILVTFRAASIAMFDPELGVDYSRVVHGEQRFTYARPIIVGDRLAVVTTIENLRVAAGNDMVTTRAEVFAHDGELVVTAWSVTVARGTAGEQS